MAYTDIDKPSDYFNTKLYTGSDGTSAISGVGFQPDWTWIKCRSHGGSASFEHVLTDAVRGVNKTLVSNDTDAETTNNATGYLSVFGSDGFTVTGGDAVNGIGRTYASWNWLADNTSGSSNTSGSITSTVSTNTTSGFSIVSYTGNGSSGSTVGHGLGVAPAMIFVKNRSSANDWNGFHKSLTGTNGIFLNLTAATSPSSTFWNNTNPTSSVFTIGNHVTVNTNTNNYIAYCFAEKKGFSKFGSYTGNGSADGTFVYTGFKPAFVIIKVSSTTNDWSMYDNQRDPINQVDNYLQPNTNGAEVSDTGKGTDFLSNGFKLRTTHGTHNTSGASYIYMAFAENPLVGTNNIPATAR